MQPGVNVPAPTFGATGGSLAADLDGGAASLLLLVAAPVAASPCPDLSSPELPKLVLPSLKAEVAQIKPWTKGFCVALVETLESEEKRAFAVALFTVGGGSPRGARVELSGWQRSLQIRGYRRFDAR